MPKRSGGTGRVPATISWTDACEAWTENVHGLAVVRVSGALSAASLVPCRRALDAALRPRPQAIALDLQGVEEATAVVPVLGLLRRYVARRGARFCLVAPPAAVTRALAAAGVADMYRVVPSVVEAVQACSSPRLGATAGAQDQLRSAPARQATRTGTLAPVRSKAPV